jgi:predicted ferric reductase
MPELILQGTWPIARAAGLTAYAAITLAVVFGLLLSTGAADRWVARARSVEAHRFLSTAALALVALHALVLLADGHVRFGLLDVLVPFRAPWRGFAVGLGTVAAYAAVVVHASFFLRRRLGPRGFRILHTLSFAVFALATAHGLLAGSSAGHPFMVGVYLSATGLVVLLTAVRLAGALASPRAARVPAARAAR